MTYTTTDLIAAIKRDASIPTSQSRFSNADFLAFLNEELTLTMVGELLSMKQDYYITTSDATLVAGTSAYNIPVTAIGWKVDSVGYVDSSGNYIKLDKITRDQLGNYEQIASSSTPRAFYVRGNSIVTVPDIGSSTSGSLRFDMVRIQNELVLLGDTGLISTVADTGTDYTIVVDTAPVATGALVDVVSGTNPYNIIARGVTAAVAGTTVTITYGSDFDRAPVAGDYVCADGQTPVPNIPEDFHPILAQAAVIRCLIAKNDVKGIQTASVALSNSFDRMRSRSKNRVNDAPTKLVANNYVLNLMRGY